MIVPPSDQSAIRTPNAVSSLTALILTRDIQRDANQQKCVYHKGNKRNGKIRHALTPIMLEEITCETI
ncbi:MAG: hypothetical protein WKF71_04735 [Pyrinomonadaceae bacterium]